MGKDVLSIAGSAMTPWWANGDLPAGNLPPVWDEQIRKPEDPLNRLRKRWPTTILGMIGG